MGARIGGLSLSDDHAETPARQALFDAGGFSGYETFRQRVRGLLSMAPAAGWSHIILCDPDFSDWPLGERAMVASLNAWSQRGRSMLIVASSFDAVRIQHPRFVTWRRTWDHILQCRQCDKALDRSGAGALLSTIWTPEWVLHRTDRERCTGMCSKDARRRTEMREVLDGYLHQGAPGFAASVLGL